MIHTAHVQASAIQVTRISASYPVDCVTRILRNLLRNPLRNPAEEPEEPEDEETEDKEEEDGTEEFDAFYFRDILDQLVLIKFYFNKFSWIGY